MIEPAVHSPTRRYAWAARHTYCWACGCTGGFNRELETHHFLGGKHGRPDDECNLIRLCTRDHGLAGGVSYPGYPALTPGMVLTLKRMHDPENWNPERLIELRRPWKCLSDLEPVPDIFLNEFRRRQPAIWERIVIEQFRALTDRQRKVLLTILRYQREHGFMPTVRDLMGPLRISSPNGIMCHLKALKKKGFLTGEPNVARGLTLVGATPCPHCGAVQVNSEEVKQLEAQLSQRIEGN